MNEHTATLLMLDDLIVVHTYFMGHEKTYTYVSRKGWISEDTERGTPLLVQGAERNEKEVVRIACFDRFGDITDLDFDSPTITDLDFDSPTIYRFALGPIPADLYARDKIVRDVLDQVKRSIKQQRVANLRRQVFEQLQLTADCLQD